MHSVMFQSIIHIMFCLICRLPSSPFDSHLEVIATDDQMLMYVTMSKLVDYSGFGCWIHLA